MNLNTPAWCGLQQGHGQVGSPMYNNGGQHWGFTGAYLLYSFYVSTCLSLAQAIKSWSISCSTDQQDIWSCYPSTQSPSLPSYREIYMPKTCSNSVKKETLFMFQRYGSPGDMSPELRTVLFTSVSQPHVCGVVGERGGRNESTNKLEH